MQKFSNYLSQFPYDKILLFDVYIVFNVNSEEEYFPSISFSLSTYSLKKETLSTTFLVITANSSRESYNSAIEFEFLTACLFRSVKIY